MVLFELLYFLICIPLAGLNAHWISEGKKIKHFWNGLIHLVVASIGWYIYDWPVFVIILCNTRVVFDISLNLFRGLPTFYISPKPASIVDKLEKKWFGNDGFKPKVMYFFISVFLHWIYFEFYH